MVSHSRICIFIINEIEHLFLCLLATCVSSWLNYLFTFFAFASIMLTFFLLVVVVHCVFWLLIIYQSLCRDCLQVPCLSFTLFMVYVGAQTSLILMQTTVFAIFSYPCFESFLKYLFMLGCAGSSLLPAGVLQPWSAAAALSQAASHCSRFSCCGAQALGPQALAIVAHGLSCPTACGIFPDQGSNSCPLHHKVDS